MQPELQACDSNCRQRLLCTAPGHPVAWISAVGIQLGKERKANKIIQVNLLVI